MASNLTLHHAKATAPPSEWSRVWPIVTSVGHPGPTSKPLHTDEYIEDGLNHAVTSEQAQFYSEAKIPSY